MTHLMDVRARKRLMDRLLKASILQAGERGTDGTRRIRWPEHNILSEKSPLSDSPALLKGHGDALSTLIWFAVLYTLGAQLDEMGFMTFVGETMAQPLEGLPWLAVYVLLTVA